MINQHDGRFFFIDQGSEDKVHCRTRLKVLSVTNRPNVVFQLRSNRCADVVKMCLFQLTLPMDFEVK